MDAFDWGKEPARTNYGKLYEGRYPLLRKAFERGLKPLREEFESFCRENERWLDNYTLYTAVKGASASSPAARRMKESKREKS